MEDKFNKLLERVSERFNVDATFNFVLMLIGIQKMGSGFIKYSKEEKMDLINLGWYLMLTKKGYYKILDYDDKNWPVFKMVKNLDSMSKEQINSLVKEAVCEELSDKI